MTRHMDPNVLGILVCLGIAAAVGLVLVVDSLVKRSPSRELEGLDVLEGLEDLHPDDARTLARAMADGPTPAELECADCYWSGRVCPEHAGVSA